MAWREGHAKTSLTTEPGRVARQTEVKRNQMSAGTTNTADFLRQRVSLFQGFSDDRLRQLADGSRVVSFEANEAIAHQGEEATHFGVVLSGTIAVSVAGESGTRQNL